MHVAMRLFSMEINHKRPKNVVEIQVTYSLSARVAQFCSEHILMSSVIYY